MSGQNWLRFRSQVRVRNCVTAGSLPPPGQNSTTPTLCASSGNAVALLPRREGSHKGGLRARLRPTTEAKSHHVSRKGSPSRRFLSQRPPRRAVSGDRGLHLHRCGDPVPAIELNADWSPSDGFRRHQRRARAAERVQNDVAGTAERLPNAMDRLAEVSMRATDGSKNRVRWEGEPDNKKPDPCETGLSPPNECRVHIAGRMVMSRTSSAAPLMAPISVALPVFISIV